MNIYPEYFSIGRVTSQTVNINVKNKRLVGVYLYGYRNQPTWTMAGVIRFTAFDKRIFPVDGSNVTVIKQYLDGFTIPFYAAQFPFWWAYYPMDETLEGPPYNVELNLYTEDAANTVGTPCGFLLTTNEFSNPAADLAGLFDRVSQGIGRLAAYKWEFMK